MLERVVSGGQTGVDRAALDAARAVGLPFGGWCPAGGRAEDGCIEPRYGLRETPSADYEERTEWNVRDSDATLVLVRGEFGGGTLLTVELTRKHARPCLVLDLQEGPTVEAALQWLREHAVGVLNVAGPRESKSPGIYNQARAFLEGLFEICAAPEPGQG